MGWTDVCSWTTCLGDRKDADEQVAPMRSGSRSAFKDTIEGVTEKKVKIPEIFKHPPPPPPSVISEAPKPQGRMDRDLPPVPPVPPVPAVYELGLASPRTGMTRANSRGSTRTSNSSKSRKRQTQNIEKRTTTIGSPTDLRKLEGAMPGTDSAGYRGSELGEDTTSRRTTIHRPLVLSIHEDDGKLSPLPVFSQRSSPTRPKSFEDAPIACDEEEYEDDEEYYIAEDDESLKTLHRRSDSAPIPVRTSSTTHTIRRKPVTPKTSVSFPRPQTIAGTTLETYTEQQDISDEPVEMYVPAFELSADPKSRTQSYYADAGAALLAATLDEAPPLPEKLPNLVVNTDMKRSLSAHASSTRTSRASSTVETPGSKKLPFSPLTTIGSPVDDPSVSPITPRTGRSFNRATLMKRSKSVGPFPMPPRHSSSLKRRSLEEPPLPTLPSTVYSPPAPQQPASRANSTSKTESTKDSRRTSNSSDSSETTSQSSQPSRGPSPSLTTIKSKRATIAGTIVPPEAELEMLKPIAYQRRSTNAPIPIGIQDAPPMPSLPPQSYQFTTPKPQEQGTHELVRSSSTENLRARANKRPSDLKRSKSTYYPTHNWNDTDVIKPLNVKNKAAPSHPPPPPPLPTANKRQNSKKEQQLKPSKTEDQTAELDCQNETRSAIVETEPRSEVGTPAEDKDVSEEPWGKGMGAEWGVAY